MMKTLAPKEALAILMALRGGDKKALELVPDYEELPIALIHLSDIAAAEAGKLILIEGECHQSRNLDDFLANQLPFEEMGKFALHLTICMVCRKSISGRGIRPFERSKELLRQALTKIQTDSESAK